MTNARQIARSLSLPAVYRDRRELREVHQDLQQNIERLFDRSISLDELPGAWGNSLFFLPYSGLDVRELRERIASAYSSACPGLEFEAPHLQTHRGNLERRPRRIGFLSMHFAKHTIAKLTSGLINKLSRDSFKVLLFRFPDRTQRLVDAVEAIALPAHLDELQRLARPIGDEVVDLPADLARARRAISEQELDALIYTDVGMDALPYFLAFARLAPVQCAMWGHPVTTGLPTVDYFISSACLEPNDGGRHYTERLVELSRLPAFYPRPHPAAEGCRSPLDLESGIHHYVCAQSLFKLHPDFDDIIGGS